jgi:hypothetical protein
MRRHLLSDSAVSPKASCQVAPPSPFLQTRSNWRRALQLEANGSVVMYTVRPQRETGLGAQLQYSLYELPALEVKLSFFNFGIPVITCDRLCGLVVRVLGYRSGGPGSLPGTTRKM